jgi:hypothetical protein
MADGNVEEGDARDREREREARGEETRAGVAMGKALVNRAVWWLG